MDFGSKYNTRSPAVKRLMREAMEFHKPTDQYYAHPVEENLFEWHFTVLGPPDTDFAGGRYHGRITLPAEYPMKPPSIMLLTPNGRFETGKKICLSMSAHHPETWQPSWSIRTVLLAIIGFMPSKGEGAIGALDYNSQERKRLAKKSLTWVCSTCGCDNTTCLADASEDHTIESRVNKEALELASQISFKDAREVNEKTAGQNDDEKKEEGTSVEAAGKPLETTEKKSNLIEAGKETNDATESTISSEAEQGEVSAVDQPNAVPEDQTGVRRRPITKTSSAEETDSQGVRNGEKKDKKKSNGVVSLVLLWIIVISLLVLIFRRLCMDTTLIGSA